MHYKIIYSSEPLSISCQRLRAMMKRVAREISERTRAALAAAKARGTLWAEIGVVSTCTDLAKARSVRAAKADSRATDLAPTIRQLQSELSCGVPQACESGTRDGTVGHPTDREKPDRLSGIPIPTN